MEVVTPAFSRGGEIKKNRRRDAGAT